MVVHERSAGAARGIDARPDLQFAGPAAPEQGARLTGYTEDNLQFTRKEAESL